MKSTLVFTPYWSMTSDEADRVIWLQRREEPFRSLDEITSANRSLVDTFGHEYATWGIVVDMRRAPPRNDPAFEAAMHELRSATERSFARAAVLVTTQAGVLQIHRLAREDGAHTFATTDPSAAYEFARGKRAR